MNSDSSHFLPKKWTALEARYEAQRIAFSPVVFQVARLLLKLNVLDALSRLNKMDRTLEVLEKETSLNSYQLRLLLETGLSAGLVEQNADQWSLTKVGQFILTDEMFKVNADFIHEVCYLGLHKLEESLLQKKPVGLEHLGNWATVYEGLSKLPGQVKEAWLNFDHYYSDSAFPQALPFLFEKTHKRLMDIGCNTGKWTKQVLTYNDGIEVTLVDLPGQLDMCLANLKNAHLDSRVRTAQMDITQTSLPLPKGCDAIWMSQFLVCFDEDTAKSILTRANQALEPDGFVYILDTFWDLQKHEIASYCLINTSPYFTAIANGVSKMFTSQDILRLAKESGLVLDKQWNDLGISHTLMRFKRS